MVKSEMLLSTHMALLSRILVATFSTTNNVKLIVNSQLFVAHKSYLRMNLYLFMHIFLFISVYVYNTFVLLQKTYQSRLFTIDNSCDINKMKMVDKKL